MRVSEAIIQNGNIAVNTENAFTATYKGYRIVICATRSLAKYAHLRNYSILVTIVKTGIHIVQKCEDHHNRHDAIRDALLSAGLIFKN